MINRLIASYYRYWGKPEFSTHGPYRGTWCGIELDEATGKNNGSIQGIRYFHCPPQCGIFVQLNKVELDPNGELKIRARTKTSVTSLVEKKAARKDSKYNEPPPFFYNTMPRSTSVSALNLCETSSNTKYSNRQGGAASSRLSPNHSPNHKPHPSPAVPLTSSSSTRLTPHATMGDSRQYSPKKRSFSHHSAPQLKKHSSEMNIFQRTSPRTSPIHVTQSSTYKPIKGVGGGRSKLCSYSETSSSPVLSSSVPTFNKTPLLTSTSCQDLSQLSPIKKLSVSSRRFSKKLSPDSTLLVSPPPSTIDSEDGVSYYSSTSDLSDTDLTPRSSSNSPCFLDVNSTNVPVILKPPSPPSPPSVSKTPAKSPTHKISLPTGLATPTSTLIESSRSSGAGNGECRVPSPDHQRISKIYLNSKNGRSTLDHPLVNGQAADKENKCINSNEVFVCPSSGQEMPTVVWGMIGMLIACLYCVH